MRFSTLGGRAGIYARVTAQRLPGLQRVCEHSLDFSRVNDTQRSMSRFFPYHPEHVYLLPPTIREVLAAGHLCFFIEQIMKKLDLEPFERAYSDEGGSLYHPAL